MQDTMQEVAPVETKLTEEQLADLRNQADPVDNGAAMEAILSDAAFATDLKTVRQQGERDKRYGTRSKFHTGAIVANRVQINCNRDAKTWEAKEDIRNQTIRLFAFEYAGGSGAETSEKAKTPEKVMSFIHTAHHFRNLLSENVRESLMQLAWDPITALLRWAKYDPREDEWSLWFTVDIGIADANGKTTRTVDALTIVEQLIPALVASPKSGQNLRKIMDAREEAARKAEITLLDSAQMKKAVDAKAMADRVKRNEEKAKLFDRFSQQIVAAKLGLNEVTSELIRRELIVLPKANGLDGDTLKTSTADDAANIARIWIQAKNDTAIGAIYRELRSIIAESNATKDANGDKRKVD